MGQEAHRELVDDQWPDLILGVTADRRSATHDEVRFVQHLTPGFLDRDLSREEGRDREADQKSADHDQIEFRPEAHGTHPLS
ncbi:hypothetical protein RSO01_22830 [Reyranella soli]|uniref:Uncharacterized protein n=1 Tax=Reyranella soli TaxID=1230389 RepID=A0A512N805_9HYPH|nr:hypothetical protein RSO01_22830 [Reyranella soli]